MNREVVPVGSCDLGSCSRGKLFQWEVVPTGKLCQHE